MITDYLKKRYNFNIWGDKTDRFFRSFVFLCGGIIEFKNCMAIRFILF